MQDAAVFWNKVAAKYARSPIADMKTYQRTLDRTRSYLSKEDTVLEVGCGTGSTALLLAGDVRHITASDLSANMIAIGTEKAAAEGVSNITFVTADIYDPFLDAGPYDAILAHNVLHLLEDLPMALERISRMLKPGGLFISKTVYRPGTGASLKFRLLKLILPLMQLIGKAPYVNFMEIPELEATIKAGGFELLESASYSPTSPSRYIVARKTAKNS